MMNHELAIHLLDLAIAGEPNSTHGEHLRQLTEIRDWLAHEATAPSVVADAPRTTPPLPRFSVLITLEKTYECRDEDLALDLALADVAGRAGMEIIGHHIVSVPPDETDGEK